MGHRLNLVSCAARSLLKYTCVGVLVSITSSASAQTISESICTAILDHGIRDARQIRSNSAFRESLKEALCDQEQKYASQIKGDAQSLGIDYGDLQSSFGLSGSSASENQRLEQEYRSFCSDSSRNIVLTSSYVNNSLVVNEAALSVYSQCSSKYIDAYFKNVRSVLITATPNSKYNEFNLQVAYDGALNSPLVVDSYTRIGGTQCFRVDNNGKRVPVEQGTKILRNVILTCEKEAAEAIAFELQLENTEVSNKSHVPRAANEIDELRSTIAQLSQRVDNLSAQESSKIQMGTYHFLAKDWKKSKNSDAKKIYYTEVKFKPGMFDKTPAVFISPIQWEWKPDAEIDFGYRVSRTTNSSFVLELWQGDPASYGQFTVQWVAIETDVIDTTSIKMDPKAWVD